jgi:hypothetical protein
MLINKIQKIVVSQYLWGDKVYGCYELMFIAARNREQTIKLCFVMNLV